MNEHIENFKNKYPEVSKCDITNLLSDLGLKLDKNTIKTSNNLQKRFYDACDDGNIEEIKKCISQNMPISYYSNFIKINAVAHVAKRGHLDALDFFLKDSFIQDNAENRKHANINEIALEVFSHACDWKFMKVINHLVNEYNIESNQDIRNYIKDKCSKELKNDIIDLIEKKYLKYTLELSLDNSNENTKKLKI